jgi:hypothetical protein
MDVSERCAYILKKLIIEIEQVKKEGIIIVTFFLWYCAFEFRVSCLP